ncbi:Hpt domain-containing protein [Methylovulum psychrotolerans]|jgi:HPt (histidine-containing phosphotransfer) domain-containing protein|nr:Hpt domain-containing protein [Methylovulum psychrotolerans]
MSTVPLTHEVNVMPIIDFAVLAHLQAELPEDLYQELLALFLEQGGQRVMAIEQAIAEQDFAVLAHEIHACVSEAATFGAMQLAALASHSNGLCRQGEKAQAFAAAATIKPAWLLVYAELNK